MRRSKTVKWHIINCDPPCMFSCTCTAYSTSAARLPKVIWEQAVLQPVVADRVIAAAHNRSAVLARWRPYNARQSNTEFFDPIPLTIQNGRPIGSAVFARAMPHSPSTYTLHCATPSARKKVARCRGGSVPHLLQSSWAPPYRPPQ